MTIDVARSSSHPPYEQPREEALIALPDKIATSVSIEMENLDRTPFHQKGHIGKAQQLSSEPFPKLLEKLNGTLAA